MYKFILNCWKLRKINEGDVNIFYEKGYITEEEKNEIVNTPR